jgi:hypothetical protein
MKRDGGHPLVGLRGKGSRGDREKGKRGHPLVGPCQEIVSHASGVFPFSRMLKNPLPPLQLYDIMLYG